MRALVLDAQGARVRSDLPEPEARADHVRVKVSVVGVCATDLALARGYMGFRGVPGHEFVGEALSGPLAGQRVVGEINAGCGRCARCNAGDPRHCATRSVLGILNHSGAFAEYLALPQANLLAVPHDMPDEVAVFAEPMAAALQITEQLQVRDQHALVAGDGRLGLLCAHALHAAGARVQVAGRHAEHADLLPPGVPLHTGWLESAGPPPRALDAFDLAVEATGNPEVLARLSPLVRPGGDLVLKTTAERAVSLDLAPIVVREQRLVGSRCGRFAPALELLGGGTIPAERMVQGRYSLDRAPEALECAARPGVLKALVFVAETANRNIDVAQGMS
ncbi:MAG: alcohol dehydrogenase [Planctomycetota bacterium]|nr:MAG: alcohol dehydrogenase [Planctomycetota bacterium]